jgi:hypothetical protein
VLYDKPVYVGCSILDISKVRMMDFHFNTIHENFKGNYDLLYSDTDSLVYQIKSPNFLKWMKENEEEFALSNLAGKWKSIKNESVLGKMKKRSGRQNNYRICRPFAKKLRLQVLRKGS